MNKQKFSDLKITADGDTRASVALKSLDTLWLNTGTICNLTCANCYIESSPTNDALVYLNHQEVITLLDEIKEKEIPTKEIGITGGEPFINPDIIKIITECLTRGFDLLVLTNAMKPMMKKEKELLALKEKYPDKLTLRVSVDHFKPEMHEEERGEKTWEPMLKGLKWLSDNQFNINIGARTRWGERQEDLRNGYAELFKENNIKLDAYDKRELLLFPEMDDKEEVPEITTKCWDLVGSKPEEMMCSSSRMVVKRKGDEKPSVMACTLLAYDQQFNLGDTLEEASQDVYLNHPHCSKFCVLGGGSCSINE